MHKHELVPIKTPYEDYTIYWCSECGLVCERIGGKVYEMIPSWAENRLLSEDRKTEIYKFAPIKAEKPYSKERSRLGRGLRDIKTPKNKGLAKIFGLKNE